MDVARVDDAADFAGRDDALSCHLDRMDLAVDVALPEGEEARQLGIARGEVHELPDECLQEVRVVRHMIQDLRRREAVSGKLNCKIRHCQLARYCASARS